jgi:hypothetical protein
MAPLEQISRWWDSLGVSKMGGGTNHRCDLLLVRIRGFVEPQNCHQNCPSEAQDSPTIHYVMPNLRTVGCNKLAKPSKYAWIHSAQDHADLQDIQECYWYGRKARLLETWTTATAEPRLGEEGESTSSASDSPDSGSASTDSDALEVKA